MLSLLRWLSRRSLAFAHTLGGVLGWAAYAISGSYRRRLHANAARGAMAPAQWRASIAQAGRMVGELPRLWLRPRSEPLLPAVEWHGAERIERALDDGHGLLMLTPHLGAFEVIAQAYAERFGGRQPMVALYRPARQAWLRELEQTARQRPGLLTAPASLAGVRPGGQAGAADACTDTAGSGRAPATRTRLARACVRSARGMAAGAGLRRRRRGASGSVCGRQQSRDGVPDPPVPGAVPLGLPPLQAAEGCMSAPGRPKRSSSRSAGAAEGRRMFH
jgi:hypothetical protein